MNKKGLNFLEQHVEKIVFAIVALICLWYLFANIVFSPNNVSYDNRKFGPGEIDSYIARDVSRLQDRLEEPAEPKEEYVSRVDDYLSVLANSVRDVDVSVAWLLPGVSDLTGVNAKYDLPAIGYVSAVEAEHIRAAAYVPSVSIDSRNPYVRENTILDDLDLVTVEGRFDIAGLYQRFHENFASSAVKEEWRNDQLAQPVFGAVELQRQELLEDGNWGDWKNIGRTRTCDMNEAFGVIEKTENLPAGGIQVQLMKYNNESVMSELLQPKGYSIASAEERWYPPSLHKKWTEYKEQASRFEQIQARAADQDRTRQDRRDPVNRNQPVGGGLEGAWDLGGGATPQVTRRDRADRTQGITREAPDMSAIEDEYSDMLIREASDLSSMETLVFWSHDDTVEAGSVYRYRIRIGVLNPVAGTSQLTDLYTDMKDQVVLWSDYSDVTDAVSIPSRIYFFPNEIQEPSRTVSVQVSRYVLGYWRSRNFQVQPGEMIGYLNSVDDSPVARQARPSANDARWDGFGGAGTVTASSASDSGLSSDVDEVDFSTGAFMVDVMPVSDWTSGRNMRVQHYFNMLYSFDGEDINYMPVRSRYWPDELRQKFNEINNLEKLPRQAFRSFESTGGVSRNRTNRGGLNTPSLGDLEDSLWDGF